MVVFFLMAQVTSKLSDFITYLNNLYESDSTDPTAGDEDYTVWTALANVAINLWENEEGVLWQELFVDLVDASDGDKTTAAADFSYDLPTDFKFPASGYVWLGTGAAKTPYQVIKPQEVQLYENSSENWCYFNLPGLTLEFNPNLTMAVQTINYRYYKYATKLTTGTDTFEMSDPMFAVYYALSELKKEEGDTSAAAIATQKLEAMKVKNEMPAPFQVDNFKEKTGEGFGI